MLRILLIEDNPTDVFLFEEYIDGSDLAGSHITAVPTMQEAVLQTQKHVFDVIMLDLSLPDCQGKNTLHQAQEAFASFPVVVLSGTNDLKIAKTSVQEGIQDYLVKDAIDESLLARSINYAIERNKLTSEKTMAEKDLIERNHYLEIANRRLEQFAFTVSHNLRAPLARILGLAQIVRYQSIDQEAQQLVTMIEDSAQSLDVSIKDLMDLLVIQKNISTSVASIDVRNLLSSVTDSLSVQIQEAQATVSSDFSEARYVVYAEPVLRSVLVNLLTNAIKYRSKQRQLIIRVTLRPVTPREYCLSVRDNGSGIDLPKVGQQLFQLFARFHTHIEGKGIGLCMIKALVEDCGGRIEVESIPGVGTTFRVYFRSYPKVQAGRGTSQSDQSPVSISSKLLQDEKKVT